MTQSNYWQQGQSDDAFWSRPTETQPQTSPTGPDYTGYGFYGQDAAVSAAPTQTQAPAEPQWTQPGVGYAEPASTGQMVPYVQPTFAQPAAMWQLKPDHPSGTPALVLGILSLALFPPLGYFALFMSARAKSDISQNPGVYGNEGVITAGLVLGILGSLISTFLIIFFFWLFASFAAY